MKSLSPLLVAALAPVLWLASGCQTYTGQTADMTNHWASGNFAAAAAEADAQVLKRGDSRDAVIWQLERGATHRAAQNWETSIEALDAAEAEVNRYENEARLTISREAAATLTNLSTLPYEGQAYDKIMMNTYKALSYLQLGNFDAARVELNRALQRQREAVEINSRRIERVKNEAAQGATNNDGTRRQSVDYDRAMSDRNFSAAIQANYSQLDQYRAYGDYVNPFAEYLQAIYFMTRAVDGNDLERARKSFERLLGLLGSNPYLEEDIAAIGARLQGHAQQPVTYVIFETGSAPIRTEFRIDVPTFLNESPYFGANFPRLEPQSNFVPSLTVGVGDGQPRRSLVVADMDAIIGREFRQQLPYIITRTLIASVAKALAAAGINAAVQNNTDNPWARLAAQVATTVAQASLNQADLRTWQSLPKQIQMVRVPTPASRTLTINPAYGAPQTVTLGEGEGLVHIVHVRSVTTTGPLVISQFRL